VISQILTLYTTPVIYLFFDKLARKVKERRSRKSVNGPSLTDSP